jgi:hypothetical protein
VTAAGFEHLKLVPRPDGDAQQRLFG